MGPNYGGWHILPEVLARIGMGPAKKPAGRWVRSLERRLSLRAIETAKAVVPPRMWDRWTRRLLHAGAGWDKSRAFCVPNDYSGAIRINLSGREPNGTVARGAEYEAVCGEIRDALLQVVHAGTGRPIVREVIATRNAFQGPFLDDLPDLLVLWANESPVAEVHSPRTGTIRLDFPERRTGAHRPFGFLAASGPRIRKSPAMKPVHLLDLAPTILSLMDTRVPGRFEGRVISEMIAG
jgi:predicted AlkP superfamily phosphohydrolase/phosphomutase